MPKRSCRHTVALVTFPAAQLLDVAGPADVFTMANNFASAPVFDLVLVSASGGPIATASGVEVLTRSIRQLAPASIDTLLIAGGEAEGLRGAISDQGLASWVRRCAQSARRYGSVCSGSFALAHWGLLEGRRATTHWSAAALLERHFPGTRVEPESLYVRDGALWTSGGVTSGIDMCLAMVEEDLGRLVAARVAKQLILAARRLGNQSQFSVLLDTQAGRYADLVDWMRTHLDGDLGVQRLSERCGESERSFHRRFSKETGLTPAAFVEELRLQAARNRLEAGDSVKGAARAAGFTSDEHLVRVFRRRFEMTPAQYRLLHASS